MNNIFDCLAFTNTYVGRYVAITLLSMISAVLFMVVFKKLSNQAAIEKEKKKIAGNLFQIRLYKDNLRLILSSILSIFKHNLFYLRYSFPPILVIIIPLMIITIQINHRCGYLPLHTGDDFIVYAELGKGNYKLLKSIQCRASNGIQILTPVLRIPDQKRAYWRAKVLANAGGNEKITFFSKGKKLANKNVTSNVYSLRFVPEKIKAKGIDAFIYNAEGFIPSDALLEKLSIQYKRAQFSFLGIGLDPVVLYFILTMIFALAVKPIFKVKI